MLVASNRVSLAGVGLAAFAATLSCAASDGSVPCTWSASLAIRFAVAWPPACPAVLSWTNPNVPRPTTTASTAAPMPCRTCRPRRLAVTYSRCPGVGEVDPLAGAMTRNRSDAFRSRPRSNWLRGRLELRQPASRSSSRACCAATSRSLSMASMSSARPVLKSASFSRWTQLADSSPSGIDGSGTSRRTTGITCLFRLRAKSSSLRHIPELAESGEMMKMNFPLRRMAASRSGQNGAAGRMARPSWSQAMSWPSSESASIKALTNPASSRAYDTNATGIAVPPPAFTFYPAKSLTRTTITEPSAADSWRLARKGSWQAPPHPTGWTRAAMGAVLPPGLTSAYGDQAVRPRRHKHGS